MTPNFCTNLAKKTYPYRWWLVAAIVAAIAIVWALIFALVLPGSLSIFAVLLPANPIIGLLFFASACAFWFHPQHGFLRENGPIPKSLQTAVRWYAAIALACLILIMIAGVLVPMSLSNFQ